jgi:hypothetical protein
MTKQKESWMAFWKANWLLMDKLRKPLSSQGTLDTYSEEWRRECEARFWINRYLLHRKERGQRAADAWWREIKEGILKARGQAGLNILIADMNKEKNAKGGKS